MSTHGESLVIAGKSMILDALAARTNTLHDGLYGSQNEILLINFLKGYLGETWAVGTGEIVDWQGEVSPQCDVIIYDPSLMPIPHQANTGHVRVYAHSVVTVLEVKTVLEEAEEITKQMRKIRCFLNDAIDSAIKVIIERGGSESGMFGTLARKYDAYSAHHTDAKTTHCESYIPVHGVAFKSTALPETVMHQLEVATHYDDRYRYEVFVLDCLRDAKDVKREWQKSKKSTKEEILKAAVALTAPNGYKFSFLNTSQGIHCDWHIEKTGVGAGIIEEMTRDIIRRFARVPIASIEHSLYEKYALAELYRRG